MPSEVEFSFFFQQDNPIIGSLIKKEGFDFILRTTVEAEKMEYKSVFLPDHFMLPKNNIIYDSWTALAVLASATQKMKVASLVTPITFYSPPELAKKVVTVDHISKGRTILGAGCGWYQKEFESYNRPFETLKERVERMLEGIEVIEALWTTNGPITLQGKYYELKNAEFFPKPLQHPLPIWFGGSSLAMMKAVAKHGQGWIPFELPYLSLGEKIQKLKKLLSREGKILEDLTLALSFRTFIAEREEEVEAYMRSLSVQRDFVGSLGLRNRIVAGTPKQCASELTQYVELGINHFCLGLQPSDKILEGLRLYADEVIPNVLSG